VREDGGDGEAAGALDVHEEGAGGGHKGLELVLLGLGGRGGVEEINGEHLYEISSASLSGVVIVAIPRRRPSVAGSCAVWPPIVRGVDHVPFKRLRG
jgi:hypothetical protein